MSSSTQDLLNTPDSANPVAWQPIQLDQRIAELRCHNSHTWPCRIPPEILSEIFVLVANESKNLDWIRITHVCQHWRDTALGYLALWTDLSFTNLEFTKIMLERSKDAPLSIRCDSSNLHADVEEVLCDALSRLDIRSVDLRSRYFDSYPLRLGHLLPIIANGPSAALEKVRCEDASEERTVYLPAHFLQKTTLNLKSLELTGIGITNWSDVPLGSTLTHLVLQRPLKCAKIPKDLVADAGSPSWVQLHDALQDMPALETLSLGGYLPSEAWPAQHEDPSIVGGLPIHLRKLHTLKLKGLRTSIESFFKITLFPKVMEAEFEIEDTQDAYASSIRQFLSALDAAWDEHRKPVYHLQYCDSCAEDDDGPQYVFRFNSEQTMASTPMLEIGFSQQVNNSESNDLMNVFKERMNFSQLSMLELHLPLSLTQETWISTFGALSKLKTIEVTSNQLPAELIQALRYHDNFVPSSRGTPLNFPALAVLEFKCDKVNLGDASPLVSALQTRPRSSPYLELKICTYDHLDESVFQDIVDSLVDVTVTQGQ